MNTPNLNLVELAEQFGTDEKCRKALEQLRWKDGAKCPRCNSSATPIANRFQYDCDECHYQFSVTAGTIFHDSHLSLWKWFVATALLCESKKGMSACQVQRTIGVSYKTAWYLCHRIRAAMVETNKPKLDGKVEMRGVRGTWHHISAKHLASYREEMSFRFNNRKNPYLFRDTILKLIASSNIEYKKLTAKMQDAA